MNALTPTGGNGGSTLIPQSLEQAMRLAEMMARGKMVPEHLRNPSDMLMVIEQASRWGMSPFAVAQCTSVVQGRLMFEGKLVAAAVQSSGILEGRLTYEFTGEGATRGIIVRGTIRGETEPRDIRVELKDAKTTNGMWTKQPDQQLVYFATRAWARRHTPEVMLGVYSPEEFDAPAARPDNFAGPTIEATPEPAAAPQPPKRTSRDLLNELRADLEAADTYDAVKAVLESKECVWAVNNFKNGAHDQLTALMQAAMDRVLPDDGGAMTDDIGIENDPAHVPA